MLIAMVSLFDQATWDAVWQEIVTHIPQVVTGVLLVVIFWIAGRFARALILRVGSNRRVNLDAIHILADTMKWAVLTVGLITGLGTVGVDISALVAGLGLTGLALGIALKDV